MPGRIDILHGPALPKKLKIKFCPALPGHFGSARPVFSDPGNKNI